MIELKGQTGVYTFDPYQDSNRIGSGGMSTVFKGIRKNDNIPIAIKVLHRNMAQNQLIQFLTFINSTIQISHPNIMKMYELIQLNGIYHVICKYYDGKLLSTLIKEGVSVISRKDKWAIMRGILNGLTALHTNYPSIIHRDIKPSNIIIKSDMTPVILDFGIAKINVQHTNSAIHLNKNTPMGTFGFASPEQLTGKEVDHTADIYAAAVTFYSLLANKSQDDISKLIDSNKRILLKENNYINTSTLNVFQKSVAYDKADRYQSAQQLLAALKQSYYSNWIQRLFVN